jgi:hypothetical protein
MASDLHSLGLGIEAAVGDGAAGEFSAFLLTYESLPDLNSILAGNGAALEFPGEPSKKYAVTIGLSTRAQKSEEIKHGFGWLLGKAGPEWCQLFIHAIEERATANGQIGMLATLVKQDARISRFLKAFARGAAS